MRLSGVQYLRLTRKLLDTFTTTPIFYANAEPHIGHIYTSVVADACHRWNCLKSPSERHVFSTGTDEHGSKIYRAAQRDGKDTKEFCDDVSRKFRDLFQEFNLTNTHFIRTTDEAHKAAVQHFWKLLEKGGYIYKSTYSGYYSIVDECFYPFDQVESKMIDGQFQKVVKGSSTLVEWVEEDNYIFKLTHFRDPVRKWLKETEVVRPSNYAALAESYTEMEEDLSVSRNSQRLSWGTPVPGDSTQTIYVWLDALVNYLSVVGYPGQLDVWPPTCQIIGKDILKFHSFYWPAFLMAAELPLPKKIFVHGHWLVDNVKMSKSIGNVVHPSTLAKKYTVEGVRYFLLKQGNPYDDSNFNSSACFDVINSDLVNNIGNLLQRSTVKKMNPYESYPKISLDNLDQDVLREAGHLIELLEQLPGICENLYEEMRYYKAIETILNTMKEANRVFQATQPWKQKNQEKLNSILYMAYESLRISNILLQPIVPQFSEFCLDRLNIAKASRSLEDAKLGEHTGGSLGPNRGIALERLQK